MIEVLHPDCVCENTKMGVDLSNKRRPEPQGFL